MPDTALPVHTVAPIILRTPASAGFIARKVLSVAWEKFGAEIPAAGSRLWLIEACKAEIAWAHADYCRITGERYGAHDPEYDGHHRSEAYRLPVEQLAARVLNIHNHVHVGTVAIRQAIKSAKASRRLYPDLEIGAPWEIAYYWPQRRKHWPEFVKAARAYRAERARIDAEQIARAA